MPCAKLFALYAQLFRSFLLSQKGHVELHMSVLQNYNQSVQNEKHNEQIKKKLKKN